MTHNVTIRPFDPSKDFPGALECYNDGFGHILWPFIEHADRQFNLDCIVWLYKMSKTAFVAEIDGEVHGILLGTAPFKLTEVLSSVKFSLTVILPGILLNTYRFNSLAYKHLFQCLYGFSYHVILHPFSWKISEITLFTSRRKYRGTGMGRKLMDTYLNSVRGRHLKEANVCTDTALSYHFYESYGFKLLKKFNMKAYKHSIPGESFTGLIYGIKVAGKKNDTGRNS